MLTCGVVIATFNGTKYIQQQLESILNQTKEVDEVYIQDDCSTDDTITKVEEFIKKHQLANRWTWKVNDTNVGYSKNFRTAMEKMSSDILFLCDQDDVWRDDKVEKIMKIFDANERVFSVTTDFKTIDSEGNFYYKEKNHENPWIRKQTEQDFFLVDLKTVLCRNIAPGCTQAIRKELVHEVKNIKTNLVHDWLFNIVAAFKDGCCYYAETLTYYRIHGNNTIGIPKYILEEKTLNIIDKMKIWYGTVKWLLGESENTLKYELFNLPPQTILWIEEVVQPTSETEVYVKLYHEFEQTRIQVIQGKNIFAYLKHRRKYRDFYENALILGTYIEGVEKFGFDLKLVLKQVADDKNK